MYVLPLTQPTTRTPADVSKDIVCVFCRSKRLHSPNSTDLALLVTPISKQYKCMYSLCELCQFGVCTQCTHVGGNKRPRLSCIRLVICILKLGFYFAVLYNL